MRSTHDSKKASKPLLWVGVGLIALTATGAATVGASRARSHATPQAAAQDLGWKPLVEALTPRPPEPEPEPSDEEAATVPDQREALFAVMEKKLGLNAEAMQKVREIFAGSRLLSQGNPKTTQHPMKRSECRRIRKEAGLKDGGHAMCGAPFMVPLFDPRAGQTERDARVCIDQFEFPGVPCEYPVVFPRSREAALLCEAVGKRICDAHEWEGGCAGALEPVEKEYDWSKERIASSYFHNKDREVRWAYGKDKDHKKCGTGSFKNKKCNGGDPSVCGSNTYPAGSFPTCVSPLGVYDQHGNAAEHMNLPLAADQVASARKYGVTEMKGSWFIFQSYEAHEDDCRWRAWDWHGTTLMDKESHRNYHLGFRCCRDVEPQKAP